MFINIQLVEDQRSLDYQKRIAVAVESIAKTLLDSTSGSVDPAELTALTEDVKSHTGALAAALDPLKPNP